eukprot:258711_1
MSLFRSIQGILKRIRPVPSTIRYQKWMFSGSRTRCIAILQREHARLTLTMQSWDRLLDKLQSGIVNVDDSTSDLQKYLEFLTGYQGYHHKKEDILYEKALDSCALDFEVSKLIMETTKVNHWKDEAGDKMEEINDSITDRNISNIIKQSKMFINEMNEHIKEENTIIYPNIVEKLNESEMEKTSQILDKTDIEHANIINAMEFLSDELNQKH